MFMQQERMRYVVITAAERSNRLKIHVNSFHMQEVYTESKERYEQENNKKSPSNFYPPYLMN